MVVDGETWVKTHNEELQSVRARLIEPRRLKEVINSLKKHTILSFNKSNSAEVHKARNMRTWFDMNRNVGKFYSAFTKNYLITSSEQKHDSLVEDASVHVSRLASEYTAANSITDELQRSLCRETSGVVALLAVLRWGVKPESSKGSCHGFHFKNNEEFDKSEFVQNVMDCLFIVFDNEKLVKYTRDLLKGMIFLGHPLHSAKFHLSPFHRDWNEIDIDNFTQSFDLVNLMNNLCFRITLSAPSEIVFLANSDAICSNMLDKIKLTHQNLQTMNKAIPAFKTKILQSFKKLLPGFDSKYSKTELSAAISDWTKYLGFKRMFKKVDWGVSDEKDSAILKELSIMSARILYSQNEVLIFHHFETYTGRRCNMKTPIKSLYNWFEYQVTWCSAVLEEREKRLSPSDRIFIANLLYVDFNNSLCRDIERVFSNLYYEFMKRSPSIKNEALLSSFHTAVQDKNLSRYARREKILRIIAIYYTSKVHKTETFDCPRTMHQRYCIQKLFEYLPFLFTKIESTGVEGSIIYATDKKHILLRGGTRTGSLIDRSSIHIFDKNKFIAQAVELMEQGAFTSLVRAPREILTTQVPGKEETTTTSIVNLDPLLFNEDKRLSLMNRMNEKFGMNWMQGLQLSELHGQYQWKAQVKHSMRSSTEDLMMRLIGHLDFDRYNLSIVISKVEYILATFKETDISLGFKGATQEVWMEHRKELLQDTDNLIVPSSRLSKRKRSEDLDR